MNGDLTLEGGYWPVILGAVIAMAVAAAYAWLHRDLPRSQRLAPALLRGAAILLIGLVLARPTLRTERVSRNAGRVTILVDRSASMEVSDAQMSAGRKLLISRALSDYNPPAELLVLHDLATQLRDAARSIDGGTLPADVAGAVRSVAARLASLEPASLPEVAPAGEVLLETWQNVPGHRLDDLDPLPPARPPDGVETIGTLKLPRDAGEDFLRRITGGLTPPADGNYRFHLSADAAAVLLVDLDRDGNLEPVVRVDEKTSPGTAGSASEPVPLSADIVYPFELIHKEGTGDDHLGLEWSEGDAQPTALAAGALSLRSDPASPEQRRDALSAEFGRTLLQLVDDPQSSPAQVKRSLLDWAARFSTLFDRRIQLAFEPESTDLAAAAAQPRSDRADRLIAQLQEAFAATETRIIPFSEETPTHTDLSQPLSALTTDPNHREAAILVTDGRHVPAPSSEQPNPAVSPIEAARRLADGGASVFGLVVGSRLPPRDIATAGIVVAEIVHVRDRLSGAVLVRDTMPPGLPLTVTLTDEAGRTAWSEQTQTTGQGERRFAFDLPAAPFADSPGAEPVAEGEIRRDQVILLTARTDAVGGEARTDNNTAEAAVRLTAGSGRVLVVDGRPRWETRFLASLLERDSRWDVSTFFTDAVVAGQVLPADEEAWREFDLVVIGDVPLEAWPPDSLANIAEFVAERGGGLILLDGLRGHLAAYAESPLADILPAVRQDQAPLAVTSLQSGSGRTAGIDLAGGELATGSWSGRPAPRWVMPITVSSPAAAVLAEAVTPDSRALPAVVTARVGRGRVWYQAFDETWRWRRGDDEAAQRRYWNAVAGIVMRPPWFAENQDLAIGLDAISIPPRGSTGVRVQIKDPTALPDADGIAVRLRRLADLAGAAPAGSPPEGPVAFALEPLAGEAGGWGGQIVAPAQPGLYEISVGDGSGDESSTVAARLLVRRPAASGELSRLEADPEAVAAIASAGGGEAFPEEEVRRLRDAVGDLSQTHRQVVTYELWGGWPIFLSIVVLLGVEWLLRRRSGLA